MFQKMHCTNEAGSLYLFLCLCVQRQSYFRSVQGNFKEIRFSGSFTGFDELLLEPVGTTV